MISTQRFSFIRISCFSLSLMTAIGGLAAIFPFNASAGNRIWVPVRWCGVEGAPSMANPSAVNESTTDNVLWRRHERPTDALYQIVVDMSFRSGATAAIKNGPQSFPIIRDPSGSGGNLINSGENTDSVIMCRRVWTMGDPLYFDQNNNNVVNDGTDTLLSTDFSTVGFVALGHNDAPLNPTPGDVRFVDLNTNGDFNIGERIYRDENTDGVVDPGDTLLVDTSGTTVGNVDAADVGASLLSVPGQVKYLDLIRQPINTFNIGYPAVQGITAVSANDVEFTSIDFPVHGVAATGIAGLGTVMDDPSQYLPPGPNFTLFETQLVGHEFGHAFGLRHGDGIDDDNNGVLDDSDDPTAPVPGAGPGKLCDSNNVMSYCWLDNGTSGNPDLVFIGVGAPTSGSFTTAQADVMRDFVLTNVSDRVVDPVTPPLVSSRVDSIGEIKPPFEHLDIAEFSVSVDAARVNTIFALQTRRPFPRNTERRVEFYFLIDMDGNRTTGASSDLLKKIEIPSDFAGAEYVSIMRLLGLKVDSVTIRRFDPETGDLVQLPSEQIRATRETLKVIPDFPFGRRTIDPDGVDRGGLQEFPTQELIRIVVPTHLLEIPADASIRVEFVSHDIKGGAIDRARSSGMDFRLPVFPECRTAPEAVHQGDATMVHASGLLPNRPVHLLLGATEVANGVTDANGRAPTGPGGASAARSR